MDTIKIKVRRDARSAGIPLPVYATDGSSGMDIRASEAAEIAPGDFAAVPTGLSIEMPRGCECQVRPRSGLAAKHGVTVLNAPGTIDSDYRGEIKVILINHGKEPFMVQPGDRIAQLVFASAARAEMIEAEELSDTERGDGGFGHSGVR